MTSIVGNIALKGRIITQTCKHTELFQSDKMQLNTLLYNQMVKHLQLLHASEAVILMQRDALSY